jgi:hypothetical protein
MRCTRPAELRPFRAGIIAPEVVQEALSRLRLEKWRRARRAIAYVSKAARHAQMKGAIK